MKNTSRHIVLGGNGVTGQETTKALLKRGISVASVGRDHSPVRGVQSVIADLLDPAAAMKALEGAEVAYFTVGLPYSTKIWREQWPLIIRNVVDAAVAHDVPLVYLDNVYAYGQVEQPMTEQTPIHPTSQKGHIRADAIRTLEAAREERGLTVTIGRSANFYGPGATTSLFNSFVLDKVAHGKDGVWLFNADLPHSLTFTPDIGEGLAILGTHPAAANQTWHLPAAPALTGRDYLKIAGGADAPIKTMSLGMMRFGALFNASARETLELAYQWSKPCVLDSSAFEATFAMTPTDPREGIAKTLEFQGQSLE